MMARVFGVALLLAACAAPPAPDPWTLWTIDTLAQRGDPAITPAGATLRLLSPPFAATSATQVTANPGLTIFPAFSEGQTAAYMTTEVWQNFDEVWVQPLYIPIASYAAACPSAVPPGVKPVFGLDAATRFYSPFWQIFCYVTPEGQVFKSAKDVLDSGVKLVPGPGKICAITRDKTLGAAVAQGAAGPVRPLSNEAVLSGNPLQGGAYVDGEDVWFVDLGLNRFTWDERWVVDETPLFAFTHADANGDEQEYLDLPKVGGTGPRHAPACGGSGNCSGLPASGAPPFGSLWRIYHVLLPSSADVFAPPGQLHEGMLGQGFKGKIPASVVPDVAKYTLRVALNGPGCADGTQPCQWLDSQNAIERLPDWRINQTGTLVSCPLVLFNGKPLGP